MALNFEFFNRICFLLCEYVVFKSLFLQVCVLFIMLLLFVHFQISNNAGAWPVLIDEFVEHMYRFVTFNLVLELTSSFTLGAVLPPSKTAFYHFKE